MARGGLPGVFEHRGDLARGHRSAVEMDRKQHATPGRVGEGREDDLVRIEPGLRIMLCHERNRLFSCAAECVKKYSAFQLNINRGD